MLHNFVKHSKTQPIELKILEIDTVSDFLIIYDSFELIWTLFGKIKSRTMFDKLQKFNDFSTTS